MQHHRVILSHYPGYEPYDDERRQLAAHNAALNVVAGGPDTVADDVLGECGALINLDWRVTAELLDRMPWCRLVTLPGIGTDSVDLNAATARGVVVSNVPLAAVDDVANHAVALLCACMRRLVQLDAAVRRGHYSLDVMRPAYNPRGKTLGLIAFGNIARAVAAKMAGAFGVHVIAYDPYVSPEIGERHGVRLTTLEEVLRTSDLLSVHAPLTPGSRGLIGAPELRRMKATAYLVVTSRGGIVDEAALVRALGERWIAGAALDVQEHEPLAPGDPLLSAPNLILTPHCAGYSKEGFAEVKRLACRAVCDVLDGRWPRWVVNQGVTPKIALTSEVAS
jgi:D-3-phosphoglycerate dehydrogenase